LDARGVDPVRHGAHGVGRPRRYVARLLHRLARGELHLEPREVAAAVAPELPEVLGGVPRDHAARDSRVPRRAQKAPVDRRGAALRYPQPEETMRSEPFPSLVITEDGFVPQGAFAEAQAAYLSPDPSVLAELDPLLAEKKIGVVAHF